MKTLDVNEVIEQARFGRFHWMVMSLCALLLIFDGYDLFIYGVVLPVLMDEWNLTPVQAGALGSYALFGMMFGAFVFGPLADKIGRKKGVTICFALFSLATFLNGPTALRLHAGQHGMTGPQGWKQGAAYLGLDLRRRVVLVRAGPDRAPDVIDQNINTPPLIQRRLGCSLSAFNGFQIHFQRQDRITSQFPHQFRAVYRQHPGPFSLQALGNTTANALGRARHNGHFLMKTHRRSHDLSL
jgi:hypothetical protein